MLGAGGREGLTGGNAVAIESLRIRQLLSFPLCLFPNLLRFFGCPETSTALLIHLGSGCDTVDGHEEQLLGFNLPKQMVDISEDGSKDLLFGQPEMGVLVIRMGACMRRRGLNVCAGGKSRDAQL